MKSITAEKLRLEYEPVAILWSNTKPDGALQIKPHGQTCIMPYFAQVATKGRTAVFDRETYGCPGARAGLGFGNGYYDAFGGAGVDFMSAFFVKGAESSRNPAAYCATVQHVPERERAKFLHGERLHKDTEKAKRFMTADLPITDIAEKYVIFTPFEQRETRRATGGCGVSGRPAPDHRSRHAGGCRPRGNGSREGPAHGCLPADRGVRV